MKPEEALEILRKPELPDLSKGHIHTIGEPKRISMSEYSEARKIALEALEKQIEKKPKISDGIAYERYEYCPSCDMSVTDNYCGNCGQAIDWRNEE